jgi:ABC-type multidrug transport system ATPase subunit
MEPPPAVQLEQVIFSYGSAPVLDGVTFSITRGEIVGLLGPNGARDSLEHP